MLGVAVVGASETGVEVAGDCAAAVSTVDVGWWVVVGGELSTEAASGGSAGPPHAVAMSTTAPTTAWADISRL